MPNPIALKALLESYDEKKVEDLVRQSRAFKHIENLINKIKIVKKGEEQEEVDKIGEEIYTEGQWKEKKKEVKEKLEKTKEVIIKSEFVEVIRSIIHSNLVKKDAADKYVDIVDPFVRSLIKYKALDILKKDKLLKKFVAVSMERLKFVKIKSENDDRKFELDIVSPTPDPSEYAEKNQKEMLIFRKLLSLPETDQIIVGLLTKLRFTPAMIAEVWPRPIQNTQIQQIKQRMIENLMALLATDRQYQELTK